LRAEAMKEFQQKRNFNAEQMRMDFNQYLGSKREAALDRQREIQREADVIA